MSLYNFKLSKFGGCYVGIEATTLKDACNIYKYVARSLADSKNRAVETIEKIDREIYESANSKVTNYKT